MNKALEAIVGLATVAGGAALAYTTLPGQFNQVVVAANYLKAAKEGAILGVYAAGSLALFSYGASRLVGVVRKAKD